MNQNWQDYLNSCPEDTRPNLVQFFSVFKARCETPDSFRAFVEDVFLEKTEALHSVFSWMSGKDPLHEEVYSFLLDIPPDIFPEFSSIVLCEILKSSLKEEYAQNSMMVLGKTKTFFAYKRWGISIKDVKNIFSTEKVYKLLTEKVKLDLLTVLINVYNAQNRREEMYGYLRILLDHKKPNEYVVLAFTEFHKYKNPIESLLTLQKYSNWLDPSSAFIEYLESNISIALRNYIKQGEPHNKRYADADFTQIYFLSPDWLREMITKALQRPILKELKNIIGHIKYHEQNIRNEIDETILISGDMKVEPKNIDEYYRVDEKYKKPVERYIDIIINEKISAGYIKLVDGFVKVNGIKIGINDSKIRSEDGSLDLDKIIAIVKNNKSDPTPVSSLVVFEDFERDFIKNDANKLECV